MLYFLKLGLGYFNRISRNRLFSLDMSIFCFEYHIDNVDIFLNSKQYVLVNIFEMKVTMQTQHLCQIALVSFLFWKLKSEVSQNFHPQARERTLLNHYAAITKRFPSQPFFLCYAVICILPYKIRNTKIILKNWVSFYFAITVYKANNNTFNKNELLLMVIISVKVRSGKHERVKQILP